MGGRIISERTQIVYSSSSSRLFFTGCHIQSSTSYANQIVALGAYNTWIPNGGPLLISSAITAGSVYSRVIGGVGTVYSCPAIDTWVALEYETRSGLYVFRDSTSGGTALFICDSSVGAQSIQNSITGFEMKYDHTPANDYYIRVTSGTVPRNICLAFFQVLSG